MAWKRWYPWSTPIVSGRSERDAHACCGERHRPLRLDVQKLVDRDDERCREHDERRRREEPEPECGPAEPLRSLGFSEREVPRDLPRDGKLKRSGREQDDGQQAEQRGERAVVVAAEQSPCGEEEDVVEARCDERGSSQLSAAARSARSGAGRVQADRVLQDMGRKGAAQSLRLPPDRPAAL